MPKVTVIIPAYNAEETIKRAIESIPRREDIQTIVIDDGSTDDSAKIAKEYSNKYDNFEYIYEENQGLGHARNYGCEFAEGDYIIFLDSDDVVTPKAYERMYKSAVRNNVDMTIGNVTRFDSKRIKRIKIHKTAFSGEGWRNH